MMYQENPVSYINELYDMRSKYQKELKNPALHGDFETVVIVENALNSVEGEIARSIETLFTEEVA